MLANHYRFESAESLDRRRVIPTLIFELAASRRLRFVPSFSFGGPLGIGAVLCAHDDHEPP